MSSALPGLISDIAAIAEIPAPTFAEERRIAWLEQRLDGVRGRLERDQVGSLVWSWGAGPPELLLTAHVDTVFAADVPLGVRNDGIELHGPGVGDNATAIAIAIAVVERLLEHGNLAPGALAFTVGEEGLGNLRGAAAVCAALRPAAVIALEGHGLEHVYADAVGSVRAEIGVHGPGGHSWADRGCPSAIHALVELGNLLLESGTPDTPVNLGAIRGGTTVNAIAQEARLLVEMRGLEQAALDRFASQLYRLTVPEPLEVVLSEISRRYAHRLARDSDLLAAVLRVRRELGLPARIAAASTDANAAAALGIPAMALGIANGALMHTAAERIEIDSLALGRRQLESIVTHLLGSSSELNDGAPA